MTRLPYPYGECATEGKDEDFIYRDKTYSTEVSMLTLLHFFFENVWVSPQHLVGVSAYMYPEVPSE
jgi:hypothetical protein